MAEPTKLEATASGCDPDSGTAPASAGAPARRRFRRLIVALAAVVAVFAALAAALGGGPGPLARASPLPARPPLSQDGTCPNPGRATPLVFVHGLDSQPSEFTRYGSPSLASTLSALPGISASYFDYHAYSLEWVTNPHIGPALAADIVCLAARSAAAGGPGRVVVVAHSMGGLALRAAASETIGGRPVSSRIGLAVTIAAPNTGSWIDGIVGEASAAAGRVGATPALRLAAVQVEAWAQRACTSPAGAPAALGALIEVCGELAHAASPAGRALRPGSPQLAALAPLPASVPLYAVAGNIELRTPPVVLGPLSVTLGIPLSVGDLLVKPDSALAEAAGRGRFSGSYLDTCAADLARLLVADPAGTGWIGCEHGGLLYSPKVAAAVAGDLRSYLASLPENPRRS